MKIFNILLLFLLGLLFIGGAFFVTQLGPKRVQVEVKSYGDVEVISKELIAKSIALEDEYKKRTGINEPKADDIKVLESALASLDEYSKITDKVERIQMVRMRDMKYIINTFKSKQLFEKINELESKAKEFENNEKYDLAADAYREAITAQSELNDAYPDSKYSSDSRAGIMSRNIKLLEAKPLYEITIKAEAQAKEAMNAKNWQLAKTKYNEAIIAQHKIHQNFPDLRYSNHARMKELESQYDSLRSADFQDSISQLEEKAEKAFAAGKYIEAAEFFQDSIENQKQLNKDYPSSKFFSEANIKKWEVRKEQAVSMEEGSSIGARFKELDVRLKGSVLDGIDKLIEPLLRDAEKFRVSYPNNLIIDDKKILKLRYLNYIKEDIASIQKSVNEPMHLRVYDNKWIMMKCEVWQNLYKSVMQDNPSRNPSSDLNPVEFVVYEEAQRFCTRLSWIMGKEVDLPTKEIFLNGVGDMKYVNLNEISWHAMNSNAQTHKVMTTRPNDIGYYDLLGNVSEYLKSKDDVSIQTIGGSIQSSTDTIIGVPVIQVQANQRSRSTGFRIIMEK